MSGAPISTLFDLLGSTGQNTRCFLRRIDDSDAAQSNTARTSSFSPQLHWPDRLPPSIHLCEHLPTKMFEDLASILNHSYSDQAGRTSFTDEWGDDVTPNEVFLSLRRQCHGARQVFQLNYENGSKAVSQSLSHLVYEIYLALTGKELEYQSEQCASLGQVISDFSYRVDGRVHILGEDKSPKVFDYFMGELMQQMRGGSTVQLCSEPVATTYDGYKAILAKLGYHAGDVQPRIRWAIVSSALEFIIIYIPRTPGRPIMFCSPTMRFCLRANEQGPATQPQIWSLLVYMLLVETLNVDEETLRQRLSVVVPPGPGGPSLSIQGLKLKAGTQERRSSQRLALRAMEEGDRRHSSSGTLTKSPEILMVRCIDACPIKLLLVNMPHPHRAKNQYHPVVHLDCHLGMGWSSVFASTKSNIVVKFAAVPKKDKAELIRQLGNEKLAYHKLNYVSGWIVPHFYGEYEWYGGRALILSGEGQSLFLGFTSLSFIERLILFAEVYWVHYLGVEHRDLNPQNILRKRWSFLFKIIDFGFSDVNHTCLGWRECGELTEMWRTLQLDRDIFQFKGMVPEFKIRVVAILLLIILLFIFSLSQSWVLL